MPLTTPPAFCISALLTHSIRQLAHKTLPEVCQSANFFVQISLKLQIFLKDPSIAKLLRDLVLNVQMSSETVLVIGTVDALGDLSPAVRSCFRHEVRERL